MPKLYVSNEDVSVRMFKGNLLERFTHVHPAVPHVIFLPVIGYMLYLSYQHGVGLVRGALLLLLGLLVWSLTEYVVHRFVFHTKLEEEEKVRERISRLGPEEAALPAITGWRQKQYWLSHGVHHDFPNDSRRLVMPPALSIPLAILFYYAFKTLVGANQTPPLFAGFVLAYLIYDTTHYATHHWRLRGKLALRLKKGHMRHHYADAAKDFGVSSRLWDVVFATVGRGTGGGTSSGSFTRGRKES